MTSTYLGQKVKVVIDRPMGSKHPGYPTVYPINYGFVPGTLAGDGEELDAYVLGPDGPMESFEGICVAVIHRIDDNEDKLVVAEEPTTYTREQILQAVNFQEQYFRSEIVTLAI